jgi:hypothetical protein
LAAVHRQDPPVFGLGTMIQPVRLSWFGGQR